MILKLNRLKHSGKNRIGMYWFFVIFRPNQSVASLKRVQITGKHVRESEKNDCVLGFGKLFYRAYQEWYIEFGWVELKKTVLHAKSWK